MTKKVLYIALAAAMILSLAGCALTGSIVSEASAANKGENPGKDQRGPEATVPEMPQDLPSQPAGSEPVIAGPEPEPDPVQQLMDSMTLREKVGQLFVITPESLCFDPATGEPAGYSQTEVTEAMKKAYDEYPCGGFCQFKVNIAGPGQIRAFNEALHALGKIRPVISVDEEGGIVRRISGREEFGIEKIPAMESIAQTGDPSKAMETGAFIGSYLHDLGFDVDFAPVADVNTNPENPVIGSRAFGSDPALAARMVAAEIEGLEQEGIMGCLKHFPGHGDTKTDTHSGYADTQKTWDQISECEMLPFKAGIKAGADFVMVAHISAPNVTGDTTPSTLSYTIVTEKLRNELGFEGIAITDAMNMGAISQNYSPVDATVKAIRAGIDMILMPANYREAFDGVMAAIENGELTEERIDESVRRILRSKLSLTE